MSKLGIIFGGRSEEHEVSVLSAASIVKAVAGTKYEPVPIGINREGRWFPIEESMEGIETLDDPRVRTLIPRGSGDSRRAFDPGSLLAPLDFAFPVLHGPYGEDGRIQGLFEMLDLPYGGCGVAASAVAMDKIFTRELWLRAGLPVCRHTTLRRRGYAADPAGERARAERALGFPIFVKPANLGSSVGIGKARSADALEAAIERAFLYDDRLILEECVDCRELEIGVLGNEEPAVSAVGEIVPEAEFYDYDSKYRGGATKLFIPADISPETAARIAALARRAYAALNAEGFARIDFFLDRRSGAVLLNEINTIPGFTAYSMFPSLWREAGVAYDVLIERIIGLGYERYYAKNNRESDNAQRRR
ncbi:MAG: D-alanine--D-alanine ligase [Clostridiales Family XIII bacterium]|jgi:D-alanine-D-alanine ligase|nr:D-alanine--D-alanine ligase [Clostridiales Family XIII bacterium]